MTVLAIDPGNIQSAYCLMNDDYTLKEFGKYQNEECMNRILNTFTFWPPDFVIIERVASYGMAVGREVFETCEWIGRFTQEIEAHTTARVNYIYRKDEKLYICHDSRAKDANIRQALIDRFAKHDLKNGKGTKANPDYFYGVSKDVWASIAIAVTWLDMRKENKNV